MLDIIKMNMNQIIHYSQSWEDQDVLLKGLDITSSDHVLSITSGGDNTLALLLQNPKSIVSIDINPVQNYLLELKITAIKNLEYEDYLKLLGVKQSGDRLKKYQLIKHDLSADAQNWWDVNLTLINEGVIHVGKLEKYARLVRTYFLPLTMPQASIKKFLTASTVEEQKRIFSQELNTKRFQLICKIFLSKPVFSLLGREKSKFEYSIIPNLSDYYTKKMLDQFDRIPVNTNYFLHYGLTGSYFHQNAMPLYLKHDNFERLRKLLPQLTIVTSDIETYLKNTPDKTFSKFYLSDIFEYLPHSQSDKIFEEIQRVAKINSVLIYWNHLVPRTHPKNMDKFFVVDQKKSEALKREDRNTAYDNLFVEKINTESYHI